MKRRLVELDSLRGIAALTVVFNHLFLLLPLFGGAMSGVTVGSQRIHNLFANTPLSVIWGGNQAVILFFVLSGYVLSLQYYKSDKPRYNVFLIRRICRIYLPYLIALTLSLALDKMLSKGGIASLSAWFNKGWTAHLSFNLILKHIVMIGPQFNTDALDSPMWSLIHEMRISIIFPILMVMVLRWNWKWNIGFGVVCSVIAVTLQSYYHASYQPVYKSLAYILMFIVGALLAKHRERFQSIVTRMKRVEKGTLLAIGLFLYVSMSWALHNHFMLKLKSLDDLETLIGASIIIVLALSPGSVSRFLNAGPIRYLGKVSYSLYLFHLLVLYSVMYTLYGLLPMWLLWIITVSVSIGLAGLCYNVIEKPSIQLGRRLTTKRRNVITTAGSSA